MHYMLISEKAQCISCQCLICGDVSPNTERHNDHLEKCHFSFADQYRGSSILGASPHLNSELRRRANEISFEDIANIRRVETETWQGQCCDYLGSSYVMVETREQDVIGLEEKYVQANLVWKEIFMRYPETEYYAVGEVNGEKRGYLLMAC